MCLSCGVCKVISFRLRYWGGEGGGVFPMSRCSSPWAGHEECLNDKPRILQDLKTRNFIQLIFPYKPSLLFIFIVYIIETQQNPDKQQWVETGDDISEPLLVLFLFTLTFYKCKTERISLVLLYPVQSCLFLVGRLSDGTGLLWWKFLEFNSWLIGQHRYWRRLS